MSIALVSFALGVAQVDLDDEEWELCDDELAVQVIEQVGLPLELAVARSGSRLVVLLDRRPPLAVSDDLGATWREAGGGLPDGVAVAISPDDPDVVVFASSRRLFVSRDGARFWSALPFELEGIDGVSLG